MKMVVLNILVVFGLSFGLFLLLLKANYSNNKFLKIFKSPSTKSTSGAVLLGGLPLAIGSFTAIMLAMGFEKETLTWIVPGALLTLVGYLDDQYEVRARVKLFFQILSIGTFSTLFYMNYQPDPMYAGLVFFFGMGAVNGSNLLDGIDTYSIKYLSVIYTALAGFCYYEGHTQIGSMSLLMTAPLGAFYFFNRYPSRVHLGEIGGGLIGLNLLFLATELFTTSSLGQTGSLNFSLDKFLMAFAFLHLPMTELGVSLLRRVLAKKSPFCGDKLHLHSLLTEKMNMKPYAAANKLSALHAVGLTTMVLSSLYINPVYSFFLSGAVYVSYYLYLGLSHWSQTDAVIDFTSFFTSLENESIHAYDFSSLNEFNFYFDYVENEKLVSKSEAS